MLKDTTLNGRKKAVFVKIFGLKYLLVSVLINWNWENIFWNRENSQDVSAGWHEWVPTVLSDLWKDLFFAWELHIWPRMIILGSVLVEIIGRSHLKKSDWLACLFHFNPLSPSQSNHHYVVYSCALKKKTKQKLLTHL